MAKTKAKKLITCTPKSLPEEMWAEAARQACAINPSNNPSIIKFADVSGFVLEQGHIAVLTNKYWGTKGVSLTVGFLDSPATDLRARILLHMNIWGKTANIKFVETSTKAQIRISRGSGGYWSYLGTDNLSIPANQQTMNLEGFTMKTIDSEFVRVIRHETGHVLGCPHEHMRQELVKRLDPTKTIDYFAKTQGWSKQTTIQQVLTPLEEGSLMGTDHAEETSIMTYQISGQCTIDGKPIIGGTDITKSDADFIAKLYPLSSPPPVPPTQETSQIIIDDATKQVRIIKKPGWTAVITN